MQATDQCIHSLIHSSVHSFNKYFLSAFYALGPVLVPRLSAPLAGRVDMGEQQSLKSTKAGSEPRAGCADAVSQRGQGR